MRFAIGQRLDLAKSAADRYCQSPDGYGFPPIDMPVLLRVGTKVITRGSFGLDFSLISERPSTASHFIELVEQFGAVSSYTHIDVQDIEFSTTFSTTAAFRPITEFMGG